MSLEYKDYYKILGVSRTATDDEIRKAFRKLARQYHPDVAKNKSGAEDKFKEINEANEVLSDPEKRRKYDTLGENWKQPGAGAGGGEHFRSRRGGNGASGAEGFEFTGTGFSDFFEQMFGSAGSRGGFGNMGGLDPNEGAGFAARGQDSEADIMVTLEESMRGAVRSVSLRRNLPCSKCGGSGAVRGKVCSACHGEGFESSTQTFKVKIPVGVREGQKLRLAGHGEAGHSGGGAGDLYLRVRLASHPDFSVEGSDLLHELDVAPWEAVLGAEVSVPTLDQPVSIRIPPGTQTGQKLRVRGRGLPARTGNAGDLYVVVRIQTPKEITDSEKKLWSQLAHESHFNPRD